MSQFYEMECNAKWDWESFVAFGPKAIESPKKLQLADWMIVDDADNNAGSFNLSAFDGNSVTSVSDGGHGSSVKSSISASTDSTTKDGMQTHNFRFGKFEGSSGNFSKKMEMNGTKFLETSPKPEASVGSGEPLIGLKLGKRTYFENSGGGGAGAGGTVKSAASFPMMHTPTPSSTTLKKTKQNARICCQVQGCITDLSLAKEYHRKHRVCDNHSKCPKVIVGGLERRFCQQCSRFHGLSEFDEKKRSCRRRLSDHNARRRKPQQETIQFNPTRLSSPFYGGSKQMSFVLNSSPLKTPESCAWDSGYNSKFTLTKGCPSKSYGDGVTDEQLHTPGTKLRNAIYMPNADNALLFATKNATSEVFNPGGGSKGSMMSSCVDAAAAAPEYDRALSLLSSNSSWDSSSQQESVPVPAFHSIPEAVPLSSSEFWLTGQHFTHSNFQSFPANTNFQDIHLSKPPPPPPYGGGASADFFSNILN
ncbi:hypothetical protein ABFS82_05G001400 [Erythranthe guttata]|uniref:squamosa promoter-binding-like protein 12 n=1 Tax=Erythranthe guttata TaxID=4155 RepID=UPI00064DF314|nr:PREDICTED: squamosa promoter-binding-like protein 12 [Erythranthe guttata]XP_012831657.1 PREDICTED: squamosa promoter-binding-like protein 12 [Erythranthe guttata]XP_012831658.1 PREDICTED: squamosa promoter-binding-like protein 12 [Erythranthe guttata]XP_012831659.1 PREDICTED: squamosa promoter-binding-like protein 12 [Erythranthe guttata]XP_012831660.1 PREDICTED: squamosa promoter-binding-like protein 12 [Erythranthe guttata]XP_012831662.1 PREDICTED: squamosa promoter-binding-like protein |eukprot:XP_012831656.1 PREDICTED: squamosa promoter-binding-like protein 12 [Erythranthe guttata]